MHHLPFDLEEWERLDKAHEALVLGMGDIYPCPELVQAILAPVENASPKQVLDTGCGTGIWALEMTSRFPHVQVKGIDISPLHSLASYPPNFSFETQDLNGDLSAYHDFFDLIFMKNVTGGVKDIDKTLKEIELCLKPGGLLIVIDGYYFVREDKEQYMKMAKLDGETETAVDSDGSWLSRMVVEMFDAGFITSRRNSGTHWVTDFGPWHHALCDPAWSASGSIHIPVKAPGLKPTGWIKKPWTTAKKPISAHYSVRSQGLSFRSRNADKELLEMKHKMWLREHFFWTRRRQGEGLPAPAIVHVATNASANSMRSTPTTTMEIYYSKGETLVSRRGGSRFVIIRFLPWRELGRESRKWNRLDT